LAGRDSYAFDSGSWDTEGPLSPVIVSHATDTVLRLIAAVTRAPDPEPTICSEAELDPKQHSDSARS
jgi:hypothetical protein